MSKSEQNRFRQVQASSVSVVGGQALTTTGRIEDQVLVIHPQAKLTPHPLTVSAVIFGLEGTAKPSIEKAVGGAGGAFLHRRPPVRRVVLHGLFLLKGIALTTGPAKSRAFLVL